MKRRPQHSLLRIVLRRTAWVLTISLGCRGGLLGNLGFIMNFDARGLSEVSRETISEGVSSDVL